LFNEGYHASRADHPIRRDLMAYFSRLLQHIRFIHHVLFGRSGNNIALRYGMYTSASPLLLGCFAIA